MKNIVIISLVALFTSCGQRPPDLKAEEEKITFAWTDWSEKTLTGKPDSIAYYFADNTLVIVPKSKPVNGRAEMIKIYAASTTNTELDIKWENEDKPNIIQFSKDGDMAYSLDRNQMPETDSLGNVHMVHNKVLHIWKKDKDGNWKVALLMASPE
ncbi:YybH family protein [Flavihumibacter fluvii]|uniref:YybH family protein n=1 Tax=Flavihumibacter fluvii TaxID=2838157 RepID=UPI001BDE8ADA|nr:hypothetical protein [Flavihumibacter fluvii]ULQ54316.1 hypothetical protein KJS93_08300 [Flavihumibacter fluvii]